MKLIYGTSNKAKLTHMRERLAELDIEIIGLEDIKRGKLPEVAENGISPLENAKIKAEAYYKHFQMPVFSCDSGLFFEGLPEEVQPGVRVRIVNGKALSDEEMIEHYGALVRKYGPLTARYKNAIYLRLADDKTFSSMADDLSGERFILTEKPHIKRVDGFPLDSLSVHIPTGKYFYDLENYVAADNMIKEGFVRFFKNALSL